MVESKLEPEMLESNDRFLIDSPSHLGHSIRLHDDPLPLATRVSTRVSETWQDTVLSGHVNTQPQDFTKPFTVVSADGNPRLGYAEYDAFGVEKENQIACTPVSRSLISHEFGLSTINPIS